MLKKMKEYLKSLRMRLLSPIIAAINELRQVETQQWDKLQASFNDALINLQSSLSEIEQVNKDILQRNIITQTKLSELHVYMERIDSWTKLFEDYYRIKEYDTENHICHIQQKMDHEIGLQHDLAIMQLNNVIPMLYRITSFLQNKEIPFVGICDTEQYRYFKELHNLTKVKEIKGTSRLIRVGRDHDGGYIMVEPFSERKIAYSVGISDDVSWDKEMAQRGYQIFQYDHTIQTLPEENPSFHWKKIGLGGEDRGDIRTLKSILTENDHLSVSGMLLKMDIEGGEWEVINNCPEDIWEKFDQIVLELHDLITPPDKKAIINALRILSKTHFVAHVHGNNHRHVEYCGDLVTPHVLEITYVSRLKYHCENKGEIFLPLEIDTPNNMSVPEIQLGNW